MYSFLNKLLGMLLDDIGRKVHVLIGEWLVAVNSLEHGGTLVSCKRGLPLAIQSAGVHTSRSVRSLQVA
jgi:hypothetical protein